MSSPGLHNHGPPRRGILINWWWTWIVSGWFVAVMALYFFSRPAWLYHSYRGISLSHEMNYAVWWSGILLFLSGLVFARVGELAAAVGRVAWIWYVLALAMLALCFDEVGSLHEIVSGISGWRGLLPFAALFGVAFGMALFELLRSSGLRLVAALIIGSVGIFVLVAGLEALEHNQNNLHHFYRKLRLVGEEGIELLASGGLLTAGLVAMQRMGDPDRRFLNATSYAAKLLDYPLIVYGLLIIQVGVTAAFIVPNYTLFLEGNPSVLFPMLLFFCLGIMARLRVKDSIHAGFWRLMTLVFFVASALQMYNLNTFVNLLVGANANIMTGPPLSWVATMLPLVGLALLGLRARRVSPRYLIAVFTLLLLTYLLVHPDLQYRYRIEYLYYLFSSLVAYSCFQLLGRLRD